MEIKTKYDIGDKVYWAKLSYDHYKSQPIINPIKIGYEEIVKIKIKQGFLGKLYDEDGKIITHVIYSMKSGSEVFESQIYDNFKSLKDFISEVFSKMES